MPFIISFLATIFFSFAGIYFGKKIKWRGRNSLRHIHRKGVLRIGGIIMVLVFNGTILLNNDLVITPGLLGMMIVSILLMLVGIWDDFQEMFWQAQLLCQVSAAVLVFIIGIRVYFVTNPFTGGIIHLNAGVGVIFSMLLVIIWITLMINSMNWLDGIDGLSGGVTFIGVLTIFALSLKPEVNQPPMAIIAIILAGTALGFLIFNFNPSKILAGTSGSMFMGFSLAVLAIFAGTKIATALLVMAVPIADFLWVLFERIKKKKSIFQSDKNHLHYRLLALGWSQKKIAVFLYAITLILAVISLNTKFIGKGVAISASFLIVILFLAFVSQKSKKLDAEL